MRQAFRKCDQDLVSEASHQAVQLPGNGILLMHVHTGAADMQFLEDGRRHQNGCRHVGPGPDNDVGTKPEKDPKGPDGSQEKIQEEREHACGACPRKSRRTDEPDREAFARNEIFLDPSTGA